MSAHEKRRVALVRNLHINIFKGMMAISTIGAYVTFHISMQPELQPTDEDATHHLFQPTTAQTFVAVAFLLYLITIGGSALAALALSFNHAMDRSYRFPSEDQSALAAAFRPSSKGLFGWDNEMWGAISAGVVFYILISAFIFVCLALAAFAPVPGVAGAVVLLIFMAVTLALWMRHLTAKKRTKRASMMLESGRISRLGPDLEAGLWNMMTAGGTISMQTQQANSITAVMGQSGTVRAPSTTAGTRPSTQRHQPIIIKEHRTTSSHT